MPGGVITEHIHPHQEERFIIRAPIWVQNLMLPTLWMLGKVLGVKAHYPRWDSRISE